MPKPRPNVPEFWEIADRLVAENRAEHGTMMAHPCLRANGKFLAAVGHEKDEMIIKLSRERVDALVASGVGEPFAPAGKRFHEWVAVPRSRAKQWPRLIEEALALSARS